MFLPSYSPDLNPIEEAFDKIKQLVRKEGARAREALVEAIGRALAAYGEERRVVAGREEKELESPQRIWLLPVGCRRSRPQRLV